MMEHAMVSENVILNTAIKNGMVYLPKVPAFCSHGTVYGESETAVISLLEAGMIVQTEETEAWGKFVLTEEAKIKAIRK
jgi:hypothetical protein